MAWGKKSKFSKVDGLTVGPSQWANTCWKACKKKYEAGASISPHPTAKNKSGKAAWVHTHCARKLIEDPQAFDSVEAEVIPTVDNSEASPEGVTVAKGAKRAKLNIGKLTGEDTTAKAEVTKGPAKLGVLHLLGRAFPILEAFAFVTFAIAQIAVCKEAIFGTRNVQITAGPGCGKSWILKVLSWIFKAMGKSGVYVAFGNVTVNDMNESGELAPGFTCSTSHREGKAILRENLSGPAIKRLNDVDHGKVKRICKGVFPYVGKAQQRQRWDNIKLACALIGKYKSELANTAEEGKRIIRRFDIPTAGAEVSKVLNAIPGILDTCKDEAEEGIIDFDDMLWAWNVLGYKPRPRQIVFVDESQDFTKAQLELVLAIAGDTGRTFMVGDSRQAIYGWRGAAQNGMAMAFDSLKAHPLGAVQLDLMETRRCSKVSVALLNMLYPHSTKAPLVAHEDNLEGVLVRVDNGSGWLSKLDRARLIVTSRCNAPLVCLALRLLKAGQKVVIRGRDFHKGIVEEIYRHSPYGNDSVPVLLANMAEFRRAELSKLAAKGETELPQGISDKLDCVRALCEGITSVKAVITKVHEIFSEDNVDGAYVLSTIHQVKGLESDWIAIVGGNMPGPWAETEAQHAEETNIQWVAFSRSKYGLIFEDTRPSCGLPKGYSWTKLDDAIANESYKGKAGIELASGEVAPILTRKECLDGLKSGELKAEVTNNVSNPEPAPVAAVTTYRLSTTLDIRGYTRGVGKNGVDCCKVTSQDGSNIGGAKRTNRTFGWRDRIIGKLNDLSGLNVPKFGEVTKGKGRGAVPVTRECWDTIKDAINGVSGAEAYYHVPQGNWAWKQTALIVKVTG